MRRIALIAFVLVLCAVAASDTKKTKIKDIARSGWLVTQTLPRSKFNKMMPLLKEALKNYPEKLEPACILRLTRSLVPRLLQNIAPGYKGPDLKEVYTVLFLTKDKKDGFYKMDVALTEAGKALLWNPPDYLTSRKDLVGKTHKLLDKKDFNGIYKIWN